MFREAFVTKVELGRSRLLLSLLLHCLLVLVVPNLRLIVPGSNGRKDWISWKVDVDLQAAAP